MWDQRKLKAPQARHWPKAERPCLCDEASAAMQEQRVFKAARRLKPSPRKAKWTVRLVLCISIHLIHTLSTVWTRQEACPDSLLFDLLGAFPCFVHARNQFFAGHVFREELLRQRSQIIRHNIRRIVVDRPWNGFAAVAGVKNRL